jgi:hypothetical protein
MGVDCEGWLCNFFAVETEEEDGFEDLNLEIPCGRESLLAGCLGRFGVFEERRLFFPILTWLVAFLLSSLSFPHFKSAISSSSNLNRCNFCCRELRCREKNIKKICGDPVTRIISRDFSPHVTSAHAGRRETPQNSGVGLVGRGWGKTLFGFRSPQGREAY